ncbi:MAG: TetR/AcrR family transcriptional regulator [Geminicoccaceae bacterium]
MKPVISASDERRHRILSAATDLFARASYEAVQMDDIARVAKVAKPTVYRHFGTKEALFGEAIDLTLNQLKSEVAGIAADAAAPHERLRAIIAVIFRRIGRLKALIRAAEAGAQSSGEVGRPAIRRELRELGGMIAAVISEGIADGGFVATDPDLAAMVVLGGVRMAADSANHDPASALADLLLHGLEPPISRHPTLERSAA